MELVKGDYAQAKIEGQPPASEVIEAENAINSDTGW